MPTLTVTATRSEGADLTLLTFAEPAPGHVHAGQYVVVEHEGAKGFFALANAPGAPVELLIKHHGQVATYLVQLAPGAPVTATDAKGPGFAVVADARPLVVLAAGSGISAVRALVDHEVRQGLPRPVHLFYGVLSPAHRSFVGELEAWAAAGAHVELVYNLPPEGWTGHTGFVQHAAEKAGLVRPDVTLVLCGFPQMVDEAKRMWIEAGLEPERVRTNF